MDKADLVALARKYGASVTYAHSQETRPSVQLRSLTADAQVELAFEKKQLSGPR